MIDFLVDLLLIALLLVANAAAWAFVWFLGRRAFEAGRVAANVAYQAIHGQEPNPPGPNATAGQTAATGPSLGTLAIVAFALWVPVASADPTVVIEAPKQVLAGKIFTVDGRKSTGIDHKWEVYSVVKAADGTVSLSREAPFPGEANKLVGYSSPYSGFYLFTLAVNDKGKTAIGSQIVEITNGVNPSPNPGPGPGPGPGPAPTPSKFGLDTFTADQANALAAPARSKAPAVATAIRGVAARIDSLNALQVASETTRAFTAAVGDQSAAWAPVSTAIQGQLRKLAIAGKLKDRADLKTAYAEIGAGLDRVKTSEDPGMASAGE